MRVLNDLKIFTKIVALVVMMGALMSFVAWRGSRSMLENDNAYSHLIKEEMADSVSMARFNRYGQMMMYASYQTLVYDGATPQARKAAAMESSSFDGAMALLSGIEKNEPDLAGQIAVFKEELKAVHRYTSAAVTAGLANRNDQAKQLLGMADEQMATLVPKAIAFTEGLIAASAKESAALSDQANATSTMLLTICGISLIAGVGIALLVTRQGITGPLSGLQNQMGEIAGGNYARPVEGIDRGDEIGAMAKAVQVFRENGIAKDAADKAKARADAEQKLVVDTVSTHLSDLSSGDLTAAITTDFPGAYALLKTNFNDALGRLRDLIASVSDSATTIRTGSQEIAQASEDLARRTESNAASLEETAASVTQMDGRLKASAASATRTVERADQAIATVGGGRAVADEAVQAMGRVSDSAKGIDSVIEGLDKIAFQTRVLAMNAAVEAGRAGDAGRGFAVVADLVSALAMRAEEEAKRARDQLTVTQTDIVTAVEAVTKVDGALAAISGDVGQVHELLATMAADNQAQSAAITQISAAIGTMDRATQQNAAMVEETSAAARNLTSEVVALNEQASHFRTGAASSAPAARQATADFAGPVRPLPAAAIPALIRQPVVADDWQSF